MAKKKLKKFLKGAAKAALIGGALYGGSKLLKGLGRKRATDAPGNAFAKARRLMTSDAAYSKAPYMDAIRRSQALTDPNIDPGATLAAKGGRIGAKSGGRVKSMGIAKRGGGVAKR